MIAHFGSSRRRYPSDVSCRLLPVHGADALMSVEDALGQSIEYAMLRLADMIQLGERDVEPASMRLRRHFFTLMHYLPVTCRGLYSRATQHTGFEYMLFYERVRLGVSSPYFFLDGVPSGVHLFVGQTSLNLPNNEIERLKLRDVVADRLQVVGKMEAMRHDSERKIELTALHTAGIGIDVPGPARFLVARSRAIFQGLRATKRNELFTHCDNCNCSRLFYKGELVESWSNAAVTQVSLGGGDDDECDSRNYWETVAGSPLDTTPDTRRFCSRACANQHAHHLEIMMPDSGLHLDADDLAKRSGRARISESFKLALKRNEIAARAMRTMRTKSMRNIAVSKEELELHREKRITALNVDIGLLYAASIIAESSNLSKGRILPGQRMYWRDDPIFYAKPLGAINKIYTSMRRKEGIVSSLVTLPRFLENIQVKAYRLF